MEDNERFEVSCNLRTNGSLQPEFRCRIKDAEIMLPNVDASQSKSKGAYTTPVTADTSLHNDEINCSLRFEKHQVSLVYDFRWNSGYFNITCKYELHTAYIHLSTSKAWLLLHLSLSLGLISQ